MGSMEGCKVRTGWLGRTTLCWDELAAVEDRTVTLRTGGVLRVQPEVAERARRALRGPALTGALSDAAAALQQHLSGDWAPERTALALLDLASRHAASDVHLEPGPAGVGVRLRLAGELVPFTTLAPDVAQRLTAAFKAVAGCLPYRRDIVQEGRVPRDGVSADVRASFVPTTFGDRVALRLFGRLLSLEQLGFDAQVRALLDEVLERDSGLLLVAGASGAGKTTTLYGLLAAVAARRPGAHLSLEDPVEQRLRVAGIPVDQVELSPERGLTGETALVAALRQDVDVLGVGEVRTPAEAGLALKAAHTGRLVLAGIHAGSVAQARQRMLDLGVDASLLDQTLQAVLHQRLRVLPCEDHTSTACARCGGLARVRAVEAALWVAPKALAVDRVADRMRATEAA